MVIGDPLVSPILPRFKSFPPLRIIVPFGFVYYFGFTAPNNAVQQQKGAKESTATSYLEEYKRKRKNGGQ